MKGLRMRKVIAERKRRVKVRHDLFAHGIWLLEMNSTKRMAGLQ